MTAKHILRKARHPWLCIYFQIIIAASGYSAVWAATTDGPASWGFPDQPPWGVRRKIMEIDRTRISKYRSGQYKPVYSTTFSDPDELSAKWKLVSEDKPNLQSCRRPENITVSRDGLTLCTKLASDCKNKWSTGSIISNFQQKYGFFEATIKTADCSGINNAFWLTTADNFEIDICEVHYPNKVDTTLHNWNDYSEHLKRGDHPSVGYHQKFRDNFSNGYHDFGVLWTGNVAVFEVDGEPITAIITNGSIHGPANIRFSTAVAPFAGKVPEHPEGHNMHVKSLRIFAQEP